MQYQMLAFLEYVLETRMSWRKQTTTSEGKHIYFWSNLISLVFQVKQNFEIGEVKVKLKGMQRAGLRSMYSWDGYVWIHMSTNTLLKCFSF